MRRDSGPAIAAGAAFAVARDNEAVVLALAADHVVRDTAAFIAACRQGLAAAESGRIVTFGVKPERPATEYGYINPGEAVSGDVRTIAKFVEKPDQAHQVRLSLEQRQLHVPRFRAARRIPQCRRKERGGRRRFRDQSRARSRLCHALFRSVSQVAGHREGHRDLVTAF
jgi:hypothetical protein